jgi:4-amino-4-deoxy-L-arabinose transferase-like glycosyltransferase
MKNVLAVLGLLCIAPFALASATVIIAILWALFVVSLKLIFIVGGLLLVLGVLSLLITPLVDQYDEHKRKTSADSRVD